MSAKPNVWMDGHRQSRDQLVPFATDAQEAVEQARLTAGAGWYWAGTVRHTPTERWPGAWTVRLHRLGR
jgi:hypothetical protein